MLMATMRSGHPSCVVLIQDERTLISFATVLRKTIWCHKLIRFLTISRSCEHIPTLSTRTHDNSRLPWHKKFSKYSRCFVDCLFIHTYIYILIHTDTNAHTYIHTYIHTHMLSTEIKGYAPWQPWDQHYGRPQTITNWFSECTARYTQPATSRTSLPWRPGYPSS